MGKKLELLSIAALISLCGCGHAENNSVETKEVKIKQLVADAIVTPDGSYMDFSYTTNPVNTKNDTPSISISFANNSLNPVNYFTTSIDTATKTFRITCFNPFNSVATATLSFPGGASSSIALNYREKVTSVNAGANWWVYIDSTAASGYSFIDALNRRITTGYGGGGPVFTISTSSAYTIAKEAGYSYSNSLVTSINSVPLSGFAATWDNILKEPTDWSGPYYDVYYDFILPALQNVSLSDKSVFSKLMTAYGSLSNYQKNQVNQHVSGGYLALEVDKTYLGHFNAFVQFQNVSYENNFYFNMGNITGSGTCGVYIPW